MKHYQKTNLPLIKTLRLNLGLILLKGPYVGLKRAYIYIFIYRGGLVHVIKFYIHTLLRNKALLELRMIPVSFQGTFYFSGRAHIGLHGRLTP